MPDEKRSMRDIERLIRKQITVSALPSDLPPARALPAGSDRSSHDEHRRFPRTQSHGAGSRGFKPRSFAGNSARRPNRSHAHR
jgi:hypothetical protein